ncbi:MAG: AMP-binding protein [Deltaproteobacteria bacterium]|nr:AMP-binding protein [Deltaproteobacteria bacterium]
MTSPENKIEKLLEIILQLSKEVHPRNKGSQSITLDSSLERDLALDSLARVELLWRIDREFDIALPEQTLAIAETPRDLLRAISSANKTPKASFSTEPGFLSLGDVDAAPEDAQTLVDVLDWYVRSHPNRSHIYLYGEEEKGEEITYADLQKGAAAVAAGLRELDVHPGHGVAIMLPTSRDYFFSFFGILLAGAIPVPLYPPVRLSQIEDHLRRHAAILNNALISILITLPEALPVARLLKSQVEKLRKVVTVQELSAAKGEAAWPGLNSEDIAFLQYTSGSTGTPKGVVLTHANLLSNIRAMGQATQMDSTDVIVSWLPLYHDMGLIGAWLCSLYYASQLVLMSPLTFLARPERWLWAIHRHRGTISAGPNFAYQLCLNKIQEQNIEDLDLSSWRMACNGAEPVSAETITHFTERFAAYGFRPEAMAPVYGLAESSVALAFPPLHRGPVIDRIQRKPFVESGRALQTEMADEDGLLFVACGQPLAGHEIRIVDPRGRELPEREEGRLQFKGPSSTSGYFRNPEDTRNLFQKDWLNSGDLAYMAGGDVYITGRSKDIIILAGRNIYPYELEEAVGNIPGIRKGCVAVFGSKDQKSVQERIVILAETRNTGDEDHDKLHHAIENAAVDLLGIPISEIVLVPPHTVLKTSSGKIRRSASREVYEQGGTAEGKKAVWRQFARLLWAGVLPELRRLRRVTVDFMYASYTWTLFCMVTPFAWTAVAVAPKFSWSYGIFRQATRLLVRLSGTPLKMEGEEHLHQYGHFVLVANHSSYLDSLFLVAILPYNLSYVAKRELTTQFFTRVFLERIQTEFVERFDKQRGVADARQVSRVVQEGRSLVFFPEGTFYRMPGLLPFHMGAFVAAAEAEVPVIPVTIKGTRSLLRAGSWFPRRSAVTIKVSKPIPPDGRDWASAVRLRDKARVEILKHCGDPDLAD